MGLTPAGTAAPGQEKNGQTMTKNITNNIFIEGIQGLGKSTLLQAIARRLPELHVCREGDYSPVELAWCTWMTEEDYAAVLARYETLAPEIKAHTFREGSHYIVTYTAILTDIPGFHKDLEQYEIYNGRKSLAEFEQIIRTRYRNFSGKGYLSECAFLQNIVEDLMLYHQSEDDAIVDFYRRLFGDVPREGFLLLYLYDEHLEESTRVIRKERSDDKGNPLWYPLMLDYLTASPYGKAHGCQGFEDLVRHFRHRQQLELRILQEVIGSQTVILPAKQWDIDEVLHLLEPV